MKNHPGGRDAALWCWHQQPIFCPFCGKRADSSSEEEFRPCSHFLYEIAQGEFLYLSHKLGVSAGVPFDRLDDMLGQPTEFGGIEKKYLITKP